MPLATIAVGLIAIAVVFGIARAKYERQLLDAQRQAQSAAQDAAASGKDFLVEGRAVTAKPLSLIQEIRRGDSLAVVFQLTPGHAGRPAGLGDEHGGRLIPTLSVANCQVTTQAPALAKSTKAPLAAFVWQWSVDDCKSAGVKAVQLLLAFDGPQNGSDPVAFRQLAFVRITDSFSWDDTIKVLGALTALLTVASLVGGFFEKRKTGAT